MQKLQKNVRKQFLVFLMLMLGLCAKVTAQSVTQLPTEKNDSVEDVHELTIEEVMEIAEEEIERTAQEAVKAALVEVGGELAYQTEMVNQLERANGNLKIENVRLKEELQKKQNQFFYGALIGGTGGVIVTSLVFSLVMGFCK